MKSTTPKVIHKILERDHAKIILREFHGRIKMKDNLQSFSYIKENLFNEEITGMVSDFTHAEFGMNILELPKVLKFFRRNPEIKRLPHAIIVNTPEKTIFPVLAKNKLSSLRIHPFSTIDAGLHWVCTR
jgi:hypothetical protein